MFVAFMVLIIRPHYLWYLKAADVLDGSETVATSLGKIGNVEIARTKNRDWKLKHAITKKRKEVSKAVGINEKF